MHLKIKQIGTLRFRAPKISLSTPRTPPLNRPPQDWNFPGGGSPDSSNGRGTTPSLPVYLLYSLLFQSLISFIFLTFIAADILRMRCNDLLTKASLWDRYVVYQVIWLAVSHVILMPFIFSPIFHFYFAATS